MKIIGIEEHFRSPAVRASWAAAAGAGQDASESLHLGEIQDRLEELSDERLARMDENGIDVQVLSLTSPGCTISRRLRASPLHFVQTTLSLSLQRSRGIQTDSMVSPQSLPRALER